MVLCQLLLLVIWSYCCYYYH